MRYQRREDRSVRGASYLAVLIVVVLLFPLGYSLVSRVIASTPDADELFLERPDPKHKRCVRDTVYMRFHHWELLRQTREEVVRYGKRGQVTLNTCKECHTSRANFCNKCHDAVSFVPDCYGCHYYP